MHPSRKRKFWCFVGILVFSLLPATACFSTTELVEEHSFSNLVVDGDNLWFGAGYKLYRVDLSQQTATLVYDTDDIQILFAQIDGNKLFFGGSSEKLNVVWSLDLDSEKILWTHEFSRIIRFSSGFTTSPVITNELLLIGEIDRLYALDKNSGDLQWTIKKNWFYSNVLTPIQVNGQLVYGAYGL
ncbi:MAG: hypothetical protein AB1750_17555, partial [Chloroflexota bacterium]